MERVVVTRAMLGICHMQVCAEKDATDEEILEVCNRDNPAGTTHGWVRVLRADEDSCGDTMKAAPIPCDDDPERTHFLVVC